HDAADSLAMVLRLNDAEVRIAYDAPAALQTAMAFAPHVMFVDLGMPALDGIQLAQLVHDKKSLSETLLVAITGHTGAAIQKQARAAGFSHYLLKPVEIPQLLACLQEARTKLEASSEEPRLLAKAVAALMQRQAAD